MDLVVYEERSKFCAKQSKLAVLRRPPSPPKRKPPPPSTLPHSSPNRLGFQSASEPAAANPLPSDLSITFDQALEMLKNPSPSESDRRDALKYLKLLRQVIEGRLPVPHAPPALPAPPAPPAPLPPHVVANGVAKKHIPAAAATLAEPDWITESGNLKRCKSYEEIYANSDSFMNGQEENTETVYCRYCPDKTFKRVPVREENGHFTKAFGAKKQTLSKHMMLSTHCSNWRACKVMGKKAVITANKEAMDNCGSLVLSMIHLGDSFDSYPLRITLLIAMGANTGFQHHSTQAPPKWVDVFYTVARRRLAKQLAIPVNFCGDFRHVTTPFAVSANKDTVKHMPKQVTGLKLADFSHPNPSMTELLQLPPFIQFLYLGHPTAFDQDGVDLAKLIFSELEKFGITTVAMKNCVGVCGDEQYLDKNVVKHLEQQHCISGVFNVWDPGHMLELQWDLALIQCPDASEIVNAVNEVINLDLTELKKLKFVKHVQEQSSNLFIKMFKALHLVAQKKCSDGEEGNGETDEVHSEHRKNEARAKKDQLTKIIQRLDHNNFLPQLAMVNNMIQLVSRFSLAVQNKLLTMGEYVNLVDLYKLALTKLDFRTCPTPTMLYHLREFYQECENAIPGYNTENHRVNTEKQDTRMIGIMGVGEDLCAALLDQHTKYWWVGGPNSLYQRRRDDVPLILNAAHLINFIAGPHVKLTPDVKGVNVPIFKCLSCSEYLSSKHHSNKDKCKGTQFEEVQELVPGFSLSLPTDYTIAELEHLVIHPWRHELTPPHIKRVKDVFKEVCDEIHDHKAVPTLDVAARALFTCKQYWSRCQPGSLLLFLKCLIACASETYGSVMEELFQQYTDYTTNDDVQCQKEMFIKMNVPSVPLTLSWRSFMDDSIKEYMKVHPGSTFAHEGKVVNKMPITSKTAQQLIRGDLSNTNRVAGIY